MAEVLVRPGVGAVVADVDRCVKTGRPTSDRVTLRGHTLPAWVSVLLLVSVVGYLFAGLMTSRHYRITLPFDHAVLDRARSGRRWAWALGLVGGVVVVSALTVVDSRALLWLVLGGAFVVVAAVVATMNALTHDVGVRATRDGGFVVTRAHPAFAQAVRAAAVGPAPVA